ncbi:hypothetical protein K503DRAFT_866734 [Rhizopogon vinicolor AM-OR11-026]|uniref:F-box domain-containing protein n=1 Tax=Rhizopogon vinicolor AM-OR11-026 TaxID=1314800 RepID=A0A1B7MYG2_9AGAM|nr:hypothetical protein K503DRAFT_866734 [Rhizopogon vinicolor AM-OR11-026]
MHPHTVLLIPELLEKIFSFVGRDANVINAYVCKQWSEIALDFVWKELKSLPQLLRLLRPYQKRDSDGSIVFDRQPELKDWARFQKYANRVLILRYRQGQEDYYCLLDDMARTRTTLKIFPKLHTLEWLFEISSAWNEPHYSCIHGNTVKSSFFVDACARMPHIHSLDLRVGYAVHFIEADVLKLLQGLPDLKKVIFPEFCLTSIIVSALSRKNYVKPIQFKHAPEQELGEEVRVGSFAPVLEQGAFSMLQGLEMAVRLGNVVRFMKADFAPINITSLYINTYADHNPRELYTLLVTLRLAPTKQITFDTLRPVFAFQNLSTFEVVHKYPVDISLEEIEELARRWPSLENLHLNEEPLVMHDFTLDLRALVPFARHCPQLWSLGLFMDVKKIHTTQQLKPFTALSVLSVGTSRVCDPAIAAAFLSFMCPPGCKLDVDMTWALNNGSFCREWYNDVLSEVNRRSLSWEGVKDLLRLFDQIWREETEKRRALQRENENLRTRNDFSMDKPEGNIKTNDSVVPRRQTNMRKKMVAPLTKVGRLVHHRINAMASRRTWLRG